MCDQDKSIRGRPLRDERRALYHPKQATPETLIKAIADWEKRYAAYILQKPKDSISPEKKNVCLGDLFPEPRQKFLADQSTLGLVKICEEYKDAINMFCYKETRRNLKKGMSNIDMVIPYSSQSIARAEGSNCHESCQGTVWNNADEDETSKWVSVVVGEVMAFVKGKNIKTPKGKGKGKKGSEGKTNAMQVDKAGQGKGKCF